MKAIHSDMMSPAKGEPLLLELLAAAPAAASPRAITKYRYDIARQAGGGFSTHPVLAESSDEDTVDSAVSAATGLPEHKCAEVLAAYMDQLFMCSAGNRWAHAIHNLLSMLPASAGNSALGSPVRAAA